MFVRSIYFILEVSYFSDALSKYTKEHVMAIAIKETRNIGMMLVDTSKLKEVLTPSPLKCLQVLIMWTSVSLYISSFKLR